MDVTENVAALPVAARAPGVSLEEILDAITSAQGELLDAEEPATALRHAREEVDSLKQALRTRTTIGQAVGLLMSERTLTADAAFAVLVESSSHTNVKIRDIAARMVEDANERANASQQMEEGCAARGVIVKSM